MKAKTIIELATEIAENAHKGQFRKGGLPYIEHPKAVAKIVEGWVNEYLSNKPSKESVHFLGVVHYLYCGITNGVTEEDYKDVLIALAKVHDSPEDSPEYGFEYFESQKDQFREDVKLWNLWGKLIDNLHHLTRKEGVSYAEYIKNIKKYPFARVVKLADLEHNLSDLPAGTKRDKYELARLYLLSY